MLLDVSMVSLYAIHGDQELSAQGIKTICRDWLEGWHPATACPAAATAADRAESGKPARGHECAGNALHPLKGNLVGHWSVNVSGNWRLTFVFEGEDAVLVDYQDYH